MNRIVFACVIFAFVALSGCLGSTAPPAASDADGIRDLSVGDAQALILAKGDAPDLVILDIRTPAEYASGHLMNATNIDYYADDFSEQLDALNKDVTYLVYCRTGSRSGAAMPTFEELGFTDVANMAGGITAWTAAGYPTTS